MLALPPPGAEHGEHVRVVEPALYLVLAQLLEITDSSGGEVNASHVDAFYEVIWDICQGALCLQAMKVVLGQERNSL